MMWSFQVGAGSVASPPACWLSRLQDQRRLLPQPPAASVACSLSRLQPRLQLALLRTVEARRPAASKHWGSASGMRYQLLQAYEKQT